MSDSTMIKIGLTGGIGCGKSTVAKMLTQRGIPVIQADELAKQIMQSDPDVKRRLVDLLGDEIYTSDGSLNRKRIADLIFSNAALRNRLNAIVHPVVIALQQEELERLAQTGMAMAAVEAALIYEAGSHSTFDVILVVAAPEKVVLDRLKRRDPLSEDDIRKRLAAQIPVAEKVRRADYVIDNKGTKSELEAQCDAFIQWVKKQYNMF